ncbi:uncharacterized protein MYCGRDRAFT_95742 [Zymoseptoria tritici IPO323]|uniref:Uncharacterized protein n=1 Tax=Zymoseptoria tritici (strain CBS 115943 / IPO323) TaxID=336722 RepID=F9XKA9_ZYMTI|nr:uncharacterized protein MYCGRDRAFT_95742 [Zymoseptoria tritici IPO323]EGP84380.1 hypothetical protein MYCGRDRAFT_95742 [Zymoseptoria tritici IPO323]
MEDNFRTWFFKFPNGPDRFRVTHFANAGADSNVSSSLERRFTVFANGTQQTRSNVNGICEPRDGQRRIIRYASSPHRLSALEIRTGLKMLPQELRDQIQDLTFTVDWICREEKDITQQDMNILQIDHASRSRLAPLFFAGGLRLEWQGPSFGLQCWLESFPAAFKPLIDNFDCRTTFMAFTFSRHGSDFSVGPAVPPVDAQTPKTVSQTSASSSTHDTAKDIAMLGDLSTIALCTNLQSLPQELYDRIYELTFTVDSYCRRENQVTKAELSMLQVDHTTRKRLAPLFFAGGIKLEKLMSLSAQAFPSWMRGFPEHLKHLIHNFKCTFAWSHPSHGEGYRAFLEYRMLEELLKHGFCAKDTGWQGRIKVFFSEDGLAHSAD